MAGMASRKLSSKASRRRVPRRRAAAIVTATYGVATPALAYSSVLYGHQLCADFLLIALATVSYQSVRAALMNPVDSLRDE